MVAEIVRTNALVSLGMVIPEAAKTVRENNYFVGVLNVENHGLEADKKFVNGQHVFVDFTSKQEEHEEDYGQYCVSMYYRLIEEGLSC